MESRAVTVWVEFWSKFCFFFYFSFFSFRQKDEKIEVRNCVLCKGPKKIFSAPLPKHKVDLILSQ